MVSLPPVGLLSSLQSAIATRLRESDLISQAPAIDVLEEDKGDLDANIAKAVGRLGIVVSIETPALRPGDEGQPVQEAAVIISVQENVPINRGPAGSQRTWLSVAEHVIAMLVGWPPAGGWSPIEFGGLERIGPGTPVEAQVSFTTSAIIRAA